MLVNEKEIKNNTEQLQNNVQTLEIKLGEQ